jgi:hypothetical protein
MGTLKKTMILVKRFWLFLFLPVFFIIAYNHVSSLYPQYKVTAKIALKGISVTSAVDDIKSKYLIQKALGQLPFQASFYNAESPKNELYGDSVPVKFVFNDSKTISTEKWIQLETTDYNQFALANGDTSVYHKFNEPINEAYGKFTIVRNSWYKPTDEVYLIKLSQPADLLNQYYSKLRVETANDVITLSVSAGNPQKGADFLNKLLLAYEGDKHKDVNYTAAPAPRITKTVSRPEKIDNSAEKANAALAALKEKAERLDNEIAKLKTRSENASSEDRPEPTAKIGADQRKLYEAVKPYIKKPVDQFVQVPYVDEIENPDLNDEINEYNEAELAKQHLLASGQNRVQADSVNRKLMVLQSDIMEQLNAFLKNGKAPVRKASNYSASQIADMIQSKEHELAEVNKNIQEADQHKHPVVQVAAATKVVSTPVIVAPRVVIVEKPGDNAELIPSNAFVFYLIALLAGLFIPFAGWVIRRATRNTSPRGVLDKEKLRETIGNIFSVRQID